MLASVVDRMATALHSGGTLVIGNHDPLDLANGVPRPNLPDLFLAAEEIVALLDPRVWRVDVAEAMPRQWQHDGSEYTIHDTVVRATRLA